MNILVTGGAGFIGSHLCEELLLRGNKVTIVDNFSLGNMENLKDIKDNENLKIIKLDICDFEEFEKIFQKNKFEKVFHLAANSDIQASAKSPEIDYKNTFMTTYNVLVCMRKYNVDKLVFASTSAIYGDMKCTINEDMGPLLPISYYGGAKLASEAFISSYTYMNNMTTSVLRFPNVIGEHLTHGVIFDFIKKLKANKSELEILGDGLQEKSYIYVKDLVSAMLFVSEKSEQGYNYYNVSGEGTTTVNKIADIVCKEMKLTPAYKYTGGKVGWKGDVSKFKYDYNKITKLGWEANYTSDEAVEITVKNVLKNN